MILRLERLVGCQCSTGLGSGLVTALAILLLMGALFWSNLVRAQTIYFFSSDTAVKEVAAQLVESITESKVVDETCPLYLVDKEAAIGTLLVQESLVALQEALAGALNEALPAADCKVVLEERAGQTKVKQLTTHLAAEGRAGSVMTLSFHRSVGGVMLFATTYNPDGRFGTFSGKIELPVQAMDTSQPAEADVAVQPPSMPKDDHDAASRRKSFLQMLKERAGTERAE